MSAPTPIPFHLRDLRRALRTGGGTFCVLPGPSLALGAIFGLIGLALLLTPALLGASPLARVLADGFPLIGPGSLAGFFALYPEFALMFLVYFLARAHPPEACHQGPGS